MIAADLLTWRRLRFKLRPVDIPVHDDLGATLPPAHRKAVKAAIAAHRDVPGALLPVLHAVQDALGFVPKNALPMIARELNLSRAEVHGVATFYHWFRTEPSGRVVLHLCRAEACQSVGAVELEVHAKRSLGIDFHGTTADGAITLEPIYCLGNCALGPSMLIGERLCGRVTAERFDELVAEARR